ncbi:MAG: choice-of-anchor B family protein [Acidimicrobiia bacterium]|nr:choice-of-anchor B family protein [Acidimicrobiia bacterium]
MRRQHRHFVVFFGALLLASLLAPAGASAHPEGPAHHAPLPEHATPVMKAVFVDHHPPQQLESVTAAAATVCSGGSAAGYPCSNVDLESFLSLADLGGSSTEEANDIWGWTDPETGKEYALIGMTFGTAFVDISTPSAPVYLGELPTHGAFGSSWRDIKTYNNHAFIVSEAMNHGIQVFDLTQLRSLSGAPPVTLAETEHYNRIGSAHNIVINEDSGYAYAVGVSGKGACGGGLHMVDISNPGNLRSAGCFSDDGYTHDAQCVNYSGPDVAYQGREICLNSNEDTITIVDVTNKSNPMQISRTGYGGVQYTHQGWLTDDQRYFLLDDELDEQRLDHTTRTRIFDLADLDNPVFIGAYDSAVAAIDHNQYVKGNFSYQANYRAGLRILDLTGIATGDLSEVGFFDVWPADDAAHFNGAWSTYPYFDSGVVIISGIEQGLFVVRPDLGGPGGDNPPSVSVTEPAAGTPVNGTIPVTASASDDNGVTQVDFRVDGVSIGTDTDGTDGWSAPWDTTETLDGPASVSAVATDTAGQTASDSVTVTVDNVVDVTVHIGDLDGSSTATGKGGKWDAFVTATVHDADESPVAGVVVAGTWSDGTSASCQTTVSGSCELTLTGIRRNLGSVTVTVDSITGSGYGYDGFNHDPDEDSNGTSITVLSP